MKTADRFPNDLKYTGLLFDVMKQRIDVFTTASNPCSSAQCSSSQICMNKYGEYTGYQCVTRKNVTASKCNIG